MMGAGTLFFLDSLMTQPWKNWTVRMLRRTGAFVVAALTMVLLGSAASSYFVQRAWSGAAGAAAGTAPAAICAARAADPRAPKIPAVPKTIFTVVKRVKSAKAPASANMNRRNPVKCASAPAIRNATSNAMTIKGQ